MERPYAAALGDGDGATSAADQDGYDRDARGRASTKECRAYDLASLPARAATRVCGTYGTERRRTTRERALPLFSQICDGGASNASKKEFETSKLRHSNMPSLVQGCTYAYQSSGKTIHVKYVRYDPITRRHMVTSNGTHEWQANARHFGARVRPTKKKTNTDRVFLYMCHIGPNTYKVGATCAPEQRRKQIRTYTPLAKMKSLVKLPAERGRDWAKIEKSVLRRFASHRAAEGGREVLKLTAAQAGECARYMRSVGA